MWEAMAGDGKRQSLMVAHTLLPQNVSFTWPYYIPFYFICVCAHVLTCVCTCIRLLIYMYKRQPQCPQMSEEGVGLPRVGVSGSCKPWVQGTKPRSSVMVASALSHHLLPFEQGVSWAHLILLSSATPFDLLASFSSFTSLPSLPLVVDLQVFCV